MPELAAALIWSLSEGSLLRSITFPSIIDAIAMDPGEYVFYAGGRDGKIYVDALNIEWDSVRNYGKFIMGHLYLAISATSISFHAKKHHISPQPLPEDIVPDSFCKAITCLAFSTDGVTLVSGLEDGVVRVWNTKSSQMARLLKHSKGKCICWICTNGGGKIEA